MSCVYEEHVSRCEKGEFILSEINRRLVKWCARDSYLTLTFSETNDKEGYTLEYVSNMNISMKHDLTTSRMREIVLRFEDVTRFPYYHSHEFDDSIDGLIVYLWDPDLIIKNAARTKTQTDDAVRVIVDSIDGDPVCLDIADIKSSLHFS